MGDKDSLEEYQEFQEIVNFVKNLKVLNWMGDNQKIINKILKSKLEKLREAVNKDGGEFYALLDDFIKREVLSNYDVGVDIIKYPSKYEEEM